MRKAMDDDTKALGISLAAIVVIVTAWAFITLI